MTRLWQRKYSPEILAASGKNSIALNTELTKPSKKKKKASSGRFPVVFSFRARRHEDSNKSTWKVMNGV